MATGPDIHPRIKALVDLMLSIEPDPELLAAAERGESILEKVRRRAAKPEGQKRTDSEGEQPDDNRC